MKFATFDGAGKLTGFYSEDIHGVNIPAGAIQLTDEQWRDCINNQKKWMVDVATKILVLAPPPPAPAPVPNPNGFILALGAGMDPIRLNGLMVKYPLFTEALKAGRYDHAQALFGAARTAGDITDKEATDIITLASSFNLPLA